ncbi:unnamed protein product [Prorocentrum cordatum]|uniref:Calmodulin n=1 Tax=Prorocentrum cordatum TaxID=2364126 RepID=A0ABN9WHD7_9DINO|nr:unnamed protein product [Polarella glacialis]|mmetsp:Transcript_6696/g.18137  ORF Transcript_6696/g.18137 Transcript_6696/m.18137 type:complete len:164 (-) Transcript_6696:79-570(-)
MASAVPETEIREVFKLFDSEGGGIKIKEIGTVMRSLGIACPEAMLRVFNEEATKRGSTCSFGDFLAYFRRAEAEEVNNATDVAKEMQGLKTGLNRYYEKMSIKQAKEAGPDMVKLADLKHVMSIMGEKLSEEEVEEMARDIRTTCKVEDGRVSFDDFVNLCKG